MRFTLLYLYDEPLKTITMSTQRSDSSKGPIRLGHNQ